jgi:hypothetical protein
MSNRLLSGTFMHFVIAQKDFYSVVMPPISRLQRSPSIVPREDTLAGV